MDSCLRRKDGVGVLRPIFVAIAHVGLRRHHFLLGMAVGRFANRPYGRSDGAWIPASAGMMVWGWRWQPRAGFKPVPKSAGWPGLFP